MKITDIIKEIALAAGVEVEEVIALNLTENDLRNYEAESVKASGAVLVYNPANKYKGDNMNPKDMQAWKGYDDLSALRNKSSRNLRRLEAKKKKK
ncbi:hypothetical protein [Escherichia phage vB_EcoM_EP57]|nr:hypothetical protein [Escherichia phage vB_EcoM_EP57]